MSQKYIKESLNRPLQSINEEQQNNYPNSSSQNLTTYKGAYQNYNQRSYTSFDTTNTQSQVNDDDEQIDTIQLDDDRQRSRSESPVKNKKQTKKTLERSSSTLQRKHPVESLQLDDNDDDDNENAEQQNEIVLPEIKTKDLSNQDVNGKTQKIRQLQKQLSRQEEESKKQLNELQSKQSRLENAIKLLVKQTSSYGKHGQNNTESKSSFIN